VSKGGPGPRDTLIPEPSRLGGQEPIRACRGCRGPIVWGRTANDTPIPLNPERITIMDETGTMRVGRIPHHINCPMAHLFKGKGKGKGPDKR